MEVIYQVLPRIWGKGKFSDWDRKTFAYLKSLGVTAVWYTGVIRHATGQPFVKGKLGSPYAIEDYRDVNPYLADKAEDRMDEFRRLVARTHANGLKVIIDYVPNHVALNCRDLPVHDWCDYDWTDTRKVDYGNPATWEEMLSIVLFWASTGIDGLRCDMVEMVPAEFFGWLIAKVRERYPGFIFIGEAYSKGNYRRYIGELGFSYLYDKSGSYDILRSILCNGSSARNLSWNWQSLQELQPRMLNFLENHDEQRLASPFFAGSASKGYAALAWSALFNGASFMLYAGQEIGEDASDGAEGRTSIFDPVFPESLQRLHRYIHGGSGLRPEELSILTRYRSVLSLCGQEPFASGANYDFCWCNSPASGFDPETQFAFLRYTDSKACLVFCNFSDRPAEATVRIPEDLREQNGAATLPERVPMRAAAWDFDICPLLLG